MGRPGRADRPDLSLPDGAALAAADARRYDSFREGRFSYHVPVPNGRYNITLMFAEPTAAAAGERVFDVAVNGKPVLKHFDVFAAAGGKLQAVDRSVRAEAQDGALVIELQPVRGQALISALSIVPAE